MFTSEQQQAGRRLSWWWCFLLAFVLAARGHAQNTNAPAGTNQPAQPGAPALMGTNEVIVLPAYTPATEEQPEVPASATNSIGAVPVPPPETGPGELGSVQPAAPVMGISALGAAPGPLEPAEEGPGIPIWGPFDIHPHLNYTFLYGNGLQAAPGQSATTAINQLAPGFLLDLGTHWNIDYTPTLSWYSNPAFKNTTDESAALHGNWTRNNLALAFSQSYLDTTQPLIETGAQTKEESYTTALNGTYQMGSKMAFQFGVNQFFRDATIGGAPSDLKEWTEQDWLYYQAGDMFQFGVGAVFGYDNVQPGPAMPFEQIQGKIDFHPGTKLTLTVSGGYEDRQFLDPSAPPLISPIFTGALIYSNFLTTLALNTSRTVTPSLISSNVEVITTYSASIKRQLTEKFALELTGDYTIIPLTAVVPEALPEFYVGAPTRGFNDQIRDDKIASYRISLIYKVIERGTLSLYYLWRQDVSSQTDFSYTSRQVGFSFDYRY